MSLNTHEVKEYDDVLTYLRANNYPGELEKRQACAASEVSVVRYSGWRAHAQERRQTMPCYRFCRLTHVM